MTNSKQKGSRFERSVAHLFRLAGYENARRGQQYNGMNGDADVVGVPHLHIEAKHVERLNIYDAMAQSIRDARQDELPVVIHKKNLKSTLVTMEFRDWIKLFLEFEKNMREKENADVYFGNDNRNGYDYRPIVFPHQENRKKP